MTTQKPFSALVRSNGDMAVIDLQGDINGQAETALKAAYGEAEAHNPQTVLLNFSSVGYINSTGIALIVGLLAQARKSHRSLITCGLSDHYQEIFHITRLSDFMTMYPDETTAIEQVAAGGLVSNP
jgi:anti-sigma B factor antagonist